MLPTLQVYGDIVLVDSRAQEHKNIRFGDVVVSISPMNPGRVICKRVVGLVSALIWKSNLSMSELMRNRPLTSARRQGLRRSAFHGSGTRCCRYWFGVMFVVLEVDTILCQVPPGHYWLHGDNLPESRDSRDYGPVPAGLITGIVRAKVCHLLATNFAPRLG